MSTEDEDLRKLVSKRGTNRQWKIISRKPSARTDNDGGESTAVSTLVEQKNASMDAMDTTDVKYDSVSEYKMMHLHDEEEEADDQKVMDDNAADDLTVTTAPPTSQSCRCARMHDSYV